MREGICPLPREARTLLISGVYSISARGVLKVRPDTRSGGGVGGVEGGAAGFWPDTKSGGYDRVSGGPGYSRVHVYGYQ